MATDAAPDHAATLLIFGAGGHGKVVADAALASGGWGRIVASQRQPLPADKAELLAGVPLLPEADAAGAALHVAIGSGAHREAEAHRLGLGRLVSVVHPRAVVSPHACIGAGSFLAALSVLGPLAVLGRGVIVNHGAVVDHDVEVGDWSHLAPHATLGGGVRVGRGVLVGSGAVVLPGVRLADGVVLGAGAVAREDLNEAGTWVGVPARRIG